jgi:hypothetical protein
MIYDLAMLSYEFRTANKTAQYEIAKKIIHSDIEEIRRLGPKMDLDHAQLYEYVKYLALIEKHDSYETEDKHIKLLDMFGGYTDEDAYIALAHSNCMVFTHLVVHHFGKKLAINNGYINQFVMDYNRNKDNASFNKLLCLVPFVPIPDKKIVSKLMSSFE